MCDVANRLLNSFVKLSVVVSTAMLDSSAFVTSQLI